MNDLLAYTPSPAANDNTASVQPVREVSAVAVQSAEAVEAIYTENVVQLSKQKVRPFLAEEAIDEVVDAQGQIDYAKLSQLMALDQRGLSSLTLMPESLNIQA